MSSLRGHPVVSREGLRDWRPRQLFWALEPWQCLWRWFLSAFSQCHLEGAMEREAQEAGIQVRRESHEGQTAWPREGCGLGARAAGAVCLQSQVLRLQNPASYRCGPRP